MKQLIQIFAFICMFSVASFATSTKTGSTSFSREISTMTKKIKEIKSSKLKKKTAFDVNCSWGNVTNGNGVVIGTWMFCCYSDGTCIFNYYEFMT